MSKFLLLSLFLINTAFASTWESMLYNVGGKYELLHEVKITNTKDKSSHIFNKGSSFYLDRHVPLYMIKVQLFEFVKEDCSAPMFKSDMNLFTTYETPKKVEIGLQANEQCIVGVFVENKDLYTGNFLKEAN